MVKYICDEGMDIGVQMQRKKLQNEQLRNNEVVSKGE